MTRPSQHELFAETAALVRTYGWSRDDVLDLEHGDRRAWLAAAAAAAPGV
jgi:hypothetical protein